MARKREALLPGLLAGLRQGARWTAGSLPAGSGILFPDFGLDGRGGVSFNIWERLDFSAVSGHDIGADDVLRPVVPSFGQDVGQQQADPRGQR